MSPVGRGWRFTNQRMKHRFLLAAALLALAAIPSQALAELSAEPNGPSVVQVTKAPDGSFQYEVDGIPQVFIGAGYNPIYRYLSDEDRAANYERDFRILRDAGANTITGWDADKGYEQDKFDELTLTVAGEYGLGVIMPLNLPPDGNYADPAFVDDLLDQAEAKVERFKDYPAVRMWGVGNEVFWGMDPSMYPAFEQAYVRIADRFHQLDPNHPVIYRGAEDRYIPQFEAMLADDGVSRPWLLYGMNIYDKDPTVLLQRWPSYGLDRPLFVSEFGMEAATPDARAAGYAGMWKSIRCFPQYVLGGAPYAWTTDGPEPTDKIWGLMDGNSQPVDGTFAALSQLWQAEPAPPDPSCPGAASAAAVPAPPVPDTGPIVRRTQPLTAPPAPVLASVASARPAAMAPPAPAPSTQPASSPKPRAVPTPRPVTTRPVSVARTRRRSH